MGDLRAAHFAWSRLNHVQLGRYAEYLVKMEFTLLGCDIYGAEVDDRGIDFVARTDDGRYYDVQVKSVRKLNYIFFRASKFALRENLMAAIVLFADGVAPDLYLIPAARWNRLDKLFVYREYKGLKSEAEWGLSLTKSRLRELAEVSFERTTADLGLWGE
jgi:hypothetical protein